MVRFLHRITAVVLLMAWAGSSAADDSDKPINWRVLDAAKRMDAVQTRSLVEAGAAVNSRDRNGETPLMLWVKAQDAPMVAWLLQKGADVNQEALSGTTPLMAAAYAGNSVCRLAATAPTAARFTSPMAAPDRRNSLAGPIAAVY